MTDGLLSTSRALAPRSRWLRRSLIIVLGLGLCAATAIGFVTHYLPVRFFEAEQWRAANGKFTFQRTSMIEHLRLSGKLDDLTRTQAVALLGPPTATDRYPEYDLVYWLGPERGLLSIDSEWLLIRLGPDGRVSDYVLHRD